MSGKAKQKSAPNGSPNGSAGKQNVTINGDMTIYQAQEHKDALLEAVRGGDQLAIDLSDVEEFDSAGFQLLWLAKQEAARLQKKLHLTGCSPSVAGVLDLFGMDDKLAAARAGAGEEPR
jgi:anti-anti-sigma factor|tara:strand:- start:5022 stop:5378 length:357 start_codon:yes stop_codon:yes gene_type:complete